ncbi:MAG: hypothetical protein NTX64_12810 [Elusimicrobia bacterium]|nr:hypothetical protein [Elusimicrobiota bacterium]
MSSIPILRAFEAELDLKDRAVLVNRWATPFAVLTVCLGLAFAGPVGRVAHVCLALLLFTAGFNLLSPQLLHKASNRAYFVTFRMWLNVVCNGIVVWLIGGLWTPCWLLLALTPLASAIYGSAGRTLTWACLVSGFLLVRYLVLGVFSPLELAEQLTYCAFIIFGSLLVNEAVHPGPQTAPARAAQRGHRAVAGR